MSIRLNHGRLRPREIETIKDDGMHPDGGNLYLQVSGKGKAKSWLFRYKSPTHGRERAMGLGSVHTFDLDEARERARQHRQEVLDGFDPIDVRKDWRDQQRRNQNESHTFRECADDWMDHQGKNWAGNRKIDTRRRFEMYVYPFIDNGNMPIQALDRKSKSNAPQLIRDILQPIWEVKPPTAEIVRQQIESTLKRASALGYIDNPNAASIKKGEPLSLLLHPHESFYEAESHEYLPFDQVGKFMAELRSKRDKATNKNLGYTGPGLPSLAGYVIEFVVLTAVRVGQVTEAKWDDFDLENKVWVSQEHKTKKKTGMAYFVPLSKQAMALLDQMRQMQTAHNVQSDYVFPGNSRKGHMARISILRFLRNTLGCSDATIHGFRSTFGHWAEEQGKYDEKDSEMALGHQIGDKTRNIYKRNAPRIEKRRPMMQDYANFCDRTEPLPGDVIPIRLRLKAGNGTTGK
jgi:integrase